MSVRRWLVVAAAAAAAVPLGARAGQVFRGGTDMVILSVTVSDARNRPITDLEQPNFRVYEDGVPQEVTLFTRDPQPIALSLLIDASTSMEEKLTVAKEAAIGFTKRLRPGDVEQIIAFNDDVDIRQTFTGEVARLERAIRDIHTSGSTALYTAIYVALSELTTNRATAQPDEIRRQAIVVLSDGEDTTSLLRYEDVLDRSNRAGVAIYAIGLREKKTGNGGPTQGADFALRSLTQASGGRIFFVSDAAELPAIYGQIADELASQYVIGYVSRNPRRDGGWRQVTVRTDRPGAIPRTRSGYFAPSKGR